MYNEQIKEIQAASSVGESEGEHRHVDTSIGRARFTSHDSSFQLGRPFSAVDLRAAELEV